MRNELSIVEIEGARILLARTGYTGEPICFELFIENADALRVWDLLVENGANPVGLGARDSLRLEAGLPLYGHELGPDPEGNEIPAFASDLSRFAVSFSPLKGDYIGREAFYQQFMALKNILNQQFSEIDALPQRVLLFELAGRGIARHGDRVWAGEQAMGYVTSGTMVPYWETEGEGVESQYSDENTRRAIGMALVSSELWEGDEIEVEIRGRKIPATIVPWFLRGEAPPYARAVIHHQLPDEEIEAPGLSTSEKVNELIDSAMANTRWRQQDCINLIPSEMTLSPVTRLLSIMDPVGRYAEHKQVKALDEAEVFYYQGTDFIWEVEELLKKELMSYLGCATVEARVVSGQMANMTVFSAMVDYLNRADRKSEQRRMRMVMNNHIIKGGHLSAQPMGALKDYVARDPRTEKAAAVNFPVLRDNPYKIDVAAAGELLAEHKPELVILGKSMVLHPEPVAEMRAFIDEQGLDCFLMYDMAHVLGLVGPHFQNPFAEGADIVTGSTHKTFFRHTARHHFLALRRGKRALSVLGGRRAACLPGSGQQPPPRHPAGLADGHLRDERLQRRVPAKGTRQRQGFRAGTQGRGAGCIGRPGGFLHRNPPGIARCRLLARPGGGAAPGRKQHHRQLPGITRGRRFHRVRFAAHGCVRDDPFRHGTGGLW